MGGACISYVIASAVYQRLVCYDKTWYIVYQNALDLHWGSGGRDTETGVCVVVS